MIGNRVVLRNLAFNLLGYAAPVAAGFVVSPILRHELGDSTYGLWILIASILGYYGILDLGVRAAVGRNIAFHHSRGEPAEVNRVLSTALVSLGGASLLAVLGTTAAAFGYSNVLTVPADQHESVRLAILVAGLNLALTLPLSVFDAVLWAGQRFDAMNAVDIPAVVVRAVAGVWLVRSGHGLVALALLSLAVVAGMGLAKAVLSFRLLPGLRFAWRDADLGVARRLYGYGVWSWLLSITRMLPLQYIPLVVGVRLGAAAVTPYSVSNGLVSYSDSFLVGAAGVLTPLATKIHARGEEEKQRRLMVEGALGCLAMALGFLTVFVVLGEPFLIAWQGSTLGNAPLLLIVLMAGDVLPMSQRATQGVVLAQGRHKVLAIAGITECVVALSLAFVLAPWYGLLGVCLALAACGTVCRGVVPLVFGCRVVGLSVPRYLAEAFGPAVLIAFGPAALLYAVAQRTKPASLLELGLHGVGYAAAFAASFLVVQYLRRPGDEVGSDAAEAVATR